jgi:hypothetical protein
MMKSWREWDSTLSNMPFKSRLLRRRAFIGNIFQYSYEYELAFRDQVHQHPDIIRKLKQEIKLLPIFEESFVSDDTVNWYIDNILSNWAGGDDQAFSEQLVDAVLGALRPEDLAKYQDLHLKETTHGA